MLVDDEQGKARDMLIAEGAYYKADTKTNKLMNWKAINLIYYLSTAKASGFNVAINFWKNRI